MRGTPSQGQREECLGIARYHTRTSTPSVQVYPSLWCLSAGCGLYPLIFGRCCYQSCLYHPVRFRVKRNSGMNFGSSVLRFSDRKGVDPKYFALAKNKVEEKKLEPRKTRSTENHNSIFFLNFMKNIRKIQLCFLSRNGVVRSRTKKTRKGQRTPVGNGRGERWLASSPERRG